MTKMNRLKWLQEMAIPETEATLGALRAEAQALMVERHEALCERNERVGGAAASMAVSKTADAGATPARPANAFDALLNTCLPGRLNMTLPEGPSTTLAPVRHGEVKGLVDHRRYAKRKCRQCDELYDPRGPRQAYCFHCRVAKPRERGPVDKTCSCACGCKAPFTQTGHYRVNCDACMKSPECKQGRWRAYEDTNSVVHPEEPVVERPAGRRVVSQGVEFETVWSGGEGLTRVGHNSSLSGVK